MNSATAPRGPKRPKFSTARRGFEKDQVEAYLDEMKVTHDKLASSAALAERRLADATTRLEEAEERLNTAGTRTEELEDELTQLRNSEPASSGGDGDDENMKAMLAAKERIIDRAKERARQIEEEAHETARNIVSKAQDQASETQDQAARAVVADVPATDVGASPHESVALAKKEAAVILARAEQKAAAILADAKDTELAAKQAGIAETDLDELGRGTIEAAKARAESITARAEAVAAEASQDAARLRAEAAAATAQAREKLAASRAEAKRLTDESNQLLAKAQQTIGAARDEADTTTAEAEARVQMLTRTADNYSATHPVRG